MKKRYLLYYIFLLLLFSNKAIAQCGIAIAPASVTVCAGSGIQITVSDTSTSNSNPFQWSPALGLNATTGATVIATPAITTTYTVTKLNCPDKDSILVIVNPLPIPTIAITENSGKINNDGILCAGDSALLDAGNFVSYLWSNGFTTQTVFANTAGNYTVTVTDINGCTATASANVIVNPLPNPVISITENSGNTNDDGILCAGDFANLTVGNYASYQWSNGASINNTDVSTTGNYSVTVTNGKGCKANTTVTIIVNNLPVATITSPAGVCTGVADSVSFTGTSGTSPFTFIYTKNGGGYLSVTATGNAVKVAIATAIPNTFTYVLKSVTDANGCSQVLSDTTVTIVSDAPTLNQKPNRIVCDSAAITPVNFNGSTPGALVTWTCSSDIGFGTAGTGNIPASTASNATALTVVATITATASVANCTGVPMTFTITVNPKPKINSVMNQSYCNGDTVANGIAFSSVTPAATFTWTGTKNIGFGVNGNGNIPAFAAVNSTNNPNSSVITISITANGCPGSDSTFTVTVNPTPFVNSITDTAYCNGETAAAINFSSPTTGAVFNWTSNFNVGFGTKGSGVIASYTANNLLYYPVTATIVVSTSINNCIGTDSLINITVNPTPKAFVSNYDSIYCGGSIVPPIYFSSTSPDSIIHWQINNYNAGLLIDSGINFIPSFTAADTTSGQKTTEVSYYATSVQGCQDSTKNFRLRVRPSPVVNQLSAMTYCNTDQVTLPDFTSPAGGLTTFIWFGKTDIGFGTFGSGSIPQFTAYNQDTVPVNDTIYVRAIKDCIGSDTMSFVITVNPSPEINTVTDFIQCDSSYFSFGFSSTVDSTVYEWTNSNTGSGLAASGYGNIPLTLLNNPTLIPIVSNIIVMPFYKDTMNCAGISKQFKVTVYPKPLASALLKDTTFCNNQPVIIPLNGLVPNATYSWSNSNTNIGLSASGISDSLTFTTTNLLTIPDSAIITVNPAYFKSGVICLGDPINFKIVVNPTPDVNQKNNLILCSGESFTDIIFTGNVNPSVFHWANDNTNSGLPAAGNDTVYGQALVNNGFTTLVSTITYTPFYIDTDGCVGNSKTFTVTVNPKPNLAPLLPSIDTTFCNNIAVIIPLLGSVANANYNWTNSNTNIGLSLNSGMGDSLFFTTNNATLFSDSSQIWVNASLTNNGKTCLGDSANFKIIVNPSPSIFPVSNQLLCNGEKDTLIFLGPVSGTVYAWTNSNTNIGISAFGNGNTINYVANNASTTLSDSALITVSSSYTYNNKTCDGNTITFMLTVNPIATITSTLSNPVVCNGDVVSLPDFVNSLGNNAQITWVNNGPFLGLASAGTGNIIPFQTINNGSTILVDTILVAATINGCKGPDSAFTITVNPTPKVLAIANKIYCNGDTMPDIPFLSSVLNSSFSWISSDNFSGNVTSGTGNFYPSFIAVNDSSLQKNYTVKIIASANGCISDTSTFTITINPTPKLVNAIATTICDGIPFTYSAISNVLGTSFSWIRNAVPGISNAANSFPSNTVTEALHNTTSVTQNVVYQFTLSANGCSIITLETIAVKASPRVNLVTDTIFCNGVIMPEIILSSIPIADTVFWHCSNDIGYDTLDGFGNIPIDTALNNNPFAIAATIYLEAVAEGCYGMGPDSAFKISVNPSPATPLFTSTANAPNPISICGGSQNINFTINNPLAANTISYLWNISNAATATIGSPNNPNTVISFNNTTDTVIVTASAFNTVANGSCSAIVSQQVFLNANNSDFIADRKIILKQPGNLLVYPDNSLANDSGYQWGYDLKLSDTLLGPPQNILNQRYQIFTPAATFIVDTLGAFQLDTFKYCFWVLLKKGSCQSKVYYNGPYHNKPALTVINADEITVSVFPNPASEYFDFTLLGKIFGNIQLKIFNNLGQQVYQSNFEKKQQQVAHRIPLNDLQNGIYHLELYSKNNQMVSTKIVVYH